MIRSSWRGTRMVHSPILNRAYALMALLLILLHGVAIAASDQPAATPALTWTFEEVVLAMEAVGGPSRAPQARLAGPLGLQLADIERASLQSPMSDFRASPLGRLMGAKSPKHVRVNGLPGPAFDEIPTDSFQWSRDGQHYFYAARSAGGWHIVRDTVPGPAFEMIHDPGIVLDGSGERYAYVGLRQGKGVLVVDGVEDSAYDHVSAPSFTTGGRHVVCVVRHDGVRVPSVDHELLKGCEHFKYVRVAPSGGRSACVVESDGRWSVVINGERGAEYDSILPSHLNFSPDGTHVGWPAKDRTGWHPVVDGAMHAAYDEVRGPWFAPHGDHVAFKVRRGRLWSVSRDGMDGPWFDVVGWASPLFSPDGEHVLYLGVRGGRSHIVVDTLAGPAYENTSFPAWCPTTARYACRLREGKRSWLLLDGQQHPERYDAIDDSSMRFSPDGSRFAFLAKDGKNWIVNVDGTRFGPYDEATWRIAFSPDSRHWAVVATRKFGIAQERHFAVVDGRPAGEGFDSFVGGPAFLADGTLEFLAFSKGGLRRVRYRPAP